MRAIRANNMTTPYDRLCNLTPVGHGAQAWIKKSLKFISRLSTTGSGSRYREVLNETRFRFDVHPMNCLVQVETRTKMKSHAASYHTHSQASLTSRTRHCISIDRNLLTPRRTITIRTCCFITIMQTKNPKATGQIAKIACPDLTLKHSRALPCQISRVINHNPQLHSPRPAHSSYL